MRAGQLMRFEQELRDIQELLSQSSLLEIHWRGVPPTTYHVLARCGGLLLSETGDPCVVEGHVFDIILPAKFPNEAPLVIWRTPILHPNIKPPEVCLGDHWFGASTIAQICECLCEMVQLKSFNLQDPLDQDVAAWFRERIQDDQLLLPIDNRPIRDLRFPFEVNSTNSPTTSNDNPAKEA
jgi:Ubiquitin-conjugating enzyme